MRSKLCAKLIGAAALIFSYCGAVAAPAGVATAEPLATEAGVEIFTKGGNAFDAAVAMSAMLAVVEPASSGLGGGGFYLLHDAATGKDTMLDARERAPLAATRDMYLDANGEIIPRASVDGARAAAIPGLPAALVWLAENKGALPLAESLRPAIARAREGFRVNPRHLRLLKFRLAAIKNSPAAADIFLTDGQLPAENSLIVQHNLANTLQALADAGHDGFYRGAVAKKLVEGVRAAGGIWTREDLSSYQVKLRAPVVAEYQGMRIVSAALPSSGGLVLAQAFNILAGYDLADVNETDYAHLLTEAMRRAYQDRARYMGDADFVKVPVAKLVSKTYARARRKSIHMNRATPSASLGKSGGSNSTGEGMNTTHFSVVDARGNKVAATLSINYPFGSGLMPPGTGVLLNDEMDDFSAKPGAPNVYGLVGGDANAIAGGKRMLSSMSPTFLYHNDRVAVLGTPGGSRIISMVLLAALEFYRGGDARQMVDRPRFHHQYRPDEIQFEPDALSPDSIAELTARGHTLRELERTWGNMQVVIYDQTTGAVDAAADPRGRGAAVVE